MKSFSLSTRARSEFVDITRKVQIAVDDLQLKDGAVTVYCPHTTAGITINEHADPDVARDMLYHLDKAVPWDDPQYRHGEGNTAAHIGRLDPATGDRVTEHRLGLWFSPVHRTIRRETPQGGFTWRRDVNWLSWSSLLVVAGVVCFGVFRDRLRDAGGTTTRGANRPTGVSADPGTSPGGDGEVR